MAACVEIWESDPETLHYHGSGYVALGPASQEPDLTEVFERQQRIGYPSELHTGEEAVRAHMRGLYGDWRAEGLSVCLHEHRGGFAFNQESMLGLAGKARAAGARDRRGGRGDRVRVRRLGRGDRASRRARGPIEVEQVVVAVGPWIPHLWRMLGLLRPDRRPPAGRLGRARRWRCGPTGTCRRARSSWRRRRFDTADGARGPGAARRLRSSRSHDDEGRLVTDEPWGIYVKPDRESVQGGAQPLPVGPELVARPLPDRHRRARASPTSGARRSRTAWSASRAAAPLYDQVRSGGAGAFTADNFPVFDYMRPNVYVAADSNHGYKMIAVGREIARVLAGRALVAAAPVPLRALRHRRPAPGLAQPVSVELRRLRRPRRRRRRRARPVGRVAPRRARRRRARARQGPDRRRRLRGRRRDRAQLLPRPGDHRHRPAVGRDVRGRPRGLRLPPGRLPRRGARGAGRRPGRDPRPPPRVRVRVRARRRRGARAASTSPGPGRTGRRRSPRCSTSAAAAGPTRCAPCATSPTGRAPPAPRSPRVWRSPGSSAATMGWRRSRPRAGGSAASASCSRRARGRLASWGCSAATGRRSPTGRPRRGSSSCARRPPAPAPARSRPVVHLDQAGPLRSDADGSVLVDGPWGIYFRVGAGGDRGHRRRPAGPAGRSPTSTPTAPTTPSTPPSRASPSSSPPASPRRSVASAAAPATGGRPSPAGSSPTPPTTTRSATGWPRTPTRSSTRGHGFKLLALGRLAADEFLDGEPRLEPFRLSRFERGETHPASKGPYPWT